MFVPTAKLIQNNMFQYSLKGHCPEKREKAFGEVEKIIKCYGWIVAFNQSTDKSLNLVVELPNCKADKLLYGLEKYMSLSELEQKELQRKTCCEMFINLSFQN